MASREPRKPPTGAESISPEPFEVAVSSSAESSLSPGADVAEASAPVVPVLRELSLVAVLLGALRLHLPVNGIPPPHPLGTTLQ